MEFAGTKLTETLVIEELQSFHYFEFPKDFRFEGESHDFWEFVYVDKGELTVVAETNTFTLKQGNIIFHKPNEFHTVWTNGAIAPNIIIISFVCKSPGMHYFDNKIFSLGDDERNLLSVIIQEGFHAFEQPFDLPRYHLLKRKAEQPIASEQMVKIYLELFLIGIMRKGESLGQGGKLFSAAKENSEQAMVSSIIAYMNSHLAAALTLDQLCQTFGIGKTSLKIMFKEQTDASVLDYFKRLRMERAKIMIRDEKYNLSEIAELHGYSSLHAFSKQFKKTTGMPPSEYAKTVKARVQ